MTNDSHPHMEWNQDVHNLKVSDLVLLVNYIIPRGSWPLSGIIKVFPGLDNVWSFEAPSYKTSLFGSVC